jgi:RNA polymerase sigma factor (sigma-70 family)
VSAASISTPLLSDLRVVSLTRSDEAKPPVIASLTRRLKAGEDAAFREFHSLYFDRLYHFLLVVTRGQEHAAQDALQETLLRVLRYAREFSDEEIFWSWLKAVARSAARDGGRKQRRYLALLQTFAFGRIDPTPSPASNEDERLRGLIEESLTELTAGDRQLIEGKYLQGATVMELSVQTGLTEKAVESRLVRLRRLFAEKLLKRLRAS